MDFNQTASMQKDFIVKSGRTKTAGRILNIANKKQLFIEYSHSYYCGQHLTSTGMNSACNKCLESRKVHVFKIVVDNCSKKH